jgi:uncharacterized protein (DUF2141 family)
MNIGRNSLALLSLLAALQAGAADILLTVQGVRSDQGQVKLMLFEREEGFRKEDKARQVLVLPAVKGDSKGLFQGLPPGRYAVVAYHDENADGKLNLRFGMFPKEGYGLSNNFKPSGPPKFKDAAFELPSGGIQSAIQLAY